MKTVLLAIAVLVIFTGNSGATEDEIKGFTMAQIESFKETAKNKELMPPAPAAEPVKAEIEKIEKATEAKTEIEKIQERISNLEDKVNFHHPETEVSGLNSFGLGKAELDESAKQYLKNLAEKVRNKEIQIIEIIGHADISKPKNKEVTNETVSLQRAHAAISFLIEENIDTSGIKTTGAGATERYGNNKNNRRITIVIKKLK